MWYFRFTDAVLRDSRFGKIAAFQQALGQALRAAGQPEITADGRYGPMTRDAILRLCVLPTFIDQRVPETDPRFGAMTFELWDRLMAGSPPPTVHDRAFVISLSHEGTDYDQAEWNLGTSDNDSVLTWGPYGATVGHGHEVQAILRRIGQRDREILVKAFAEELETMERLLDSANGEAVLRPVHQNETRRRRWVQVFVALGQHAVARAEYEAHALSGETWLRPPLRRLYTGLITDNPALATSADYGFFLDLAMHMSISSQRIATAQSAVASRQQELGRPLEPAERRQAISRSLVPSMQQRDRLGRNVVFYVDVIGEQDLSEAERNAWRERTRRRASDCGLTDDEHFLPGFL